MRSCAVVVAFASGAAALSENYVRANAPVMFADFVRDYGRQYAGEEHARREAIFTENMVRAAQLEEGEPRASFGINRFADLSAEEFRAYHTGFVKGSGANSTKPLASPEEVSRAKASGWDWRNHGAVTGVKDQARCGSCWAFSAVCAMEGAWFLAGNTLTSLSEQELVSCGPGGGCNGGDMHDALEWVLKHGGLNAEKAYPYTSAGGSTGSCSSSKEKTSVASISSVHSIAKDEDQILATMTKDGPLSIGVDAGKFQSYKSGVMSSCSGRSLDHGVAIVGYQASHDAWIVKNSWGSSWGESGYIRLAKGSNQCGLTKEVTQAHEKKA